MIYTMDIPEALTRINVQRMAKDRKEAHVLLASPQRVTHFELAPKSDVYPNSKGTFREPWFCRFEHPRENAPLWLVWGETRRTPNHFRSQFWGREVPFSIQKEPKFSGCRNSRMVGGYTNLFLFTKAWIPIERPERWWFWVGPCVSFVQTEPNGNRHNPSLGLRMMPAFQRWPPRQGRCVRFAPHRTLPPPLPPCKKNGVLMVLLQSSTQRGTNSKTNGHILYPLIDFAKSLFYVLSVFPCSSHSRSSDEL